MKRRYDSTDNWDPLREKLIGLGEQSMRKTYYPELQKRLAELERFKALLDQSNDAIFLIKLPSLQIADINDSACRLLGYSRNELIVQSVDTLTGISREQFLKDIGVNQKDLNGQITIVTSLKKKDGTSVPVESSIRVAAFDDGGYAVAVARDITERQQAEAELLKHRMHLEELVIERTTELAVAKEKAESANKAKGTFLASMSHELRTPLNIILGYSQLLQRDAELNKDQLEYLAIINSSGKHLLGLINEILEISKIEARGVTLETNIFDFYGLISELEKMFRHDMMTRNLDLLLHIDEKIPRFLEGDGNKLKQILINLIGNALKFTERGFIEIRASFRKGSDGDIVLLVEIEDTGSGIAEKDLNRLFQFFEQVGNGNKIRSGSGLGLAISREYARLMGGDITVSSRFGQGSTFLLAVQLKMGVEQEPPALSGQSGTIIGLEPDSRAVWRILVVDDMPEGRSLLSKLLEPVGFIVRTAANGEEAVALCQKWSPHLVWMDVVMPVMDGLVATRLIKQLDRRIKIVALTASALEDDLEAIREAGCDDIMRKPYLENQVLDMMARQLGFKYIYQLESEPRSNRQEIPTNNTLDTPLPLPDPLRQELRSAVLRLNIEETRKIIDSIIKNDQATGLALSTLVEKLDFDRLLGLLDNIVR